MCDTLVDCRFPLAVVSINNMVCLRDPPHCIQCYRQRFRQLPNGFPFSVYIYLLAQ